jgi:hypothetical protein
MLRSLSALAAFTVVSCHGWSAAAQSEASSAGKGITGGALLGAEAVMITEAALGIQSGWAYLVGGLSGAVGGGVGGYFLETSSAKTNMYVLAAGLALVIPTTVAVLNATAYEPKVEYTEDRGPLDQPADEPPRPSEDAWAPESRRATSPHTARHAALRTHGLISAVGPLVTLSVPAISIAPVFDPVERATFGVGAETELRVSVVDVRF